MRSPHGFIVVPAKGKRYDNTKDIGGFEMIVSVSEEDHRYSNRFAEVIETPVGYDGPIKPGDTLLVHHNVFKYYNDFQGRQKSGRSYLKDKHFLIEWDQFFMYKNESGWHTHDKYCFVKPFQGKDMFGRKCEQALQGILKYRNEYLASKGLSNGDTVSFTPDSEYEFEIDGERLYRVIDHQIIGKA